MDSIIGICQKYGIPLIEDAAESLGALIAKRYWCVWRFVFVFNGNKIIATSGGGMLWVTILF